MLWILLSDTASTLSYTNRNFLDGDCAAVLEMVAEDNTGRGDWSVHQKVRRNWKEPSLTSEAKWAQLEDQIARLQQGNQAGQ